jgi:hypothetical protein
LSDLELLLQHLLPLSRDLEPDSKRGW